MFITLISNSLDPNKMQLEAIIVDYFKKLKTQNFSVHLFNLARTIQLNLSEKKKKFALSSSDFF